MSTGTVVPGHPSWTHRPRSSNTDPVTFAGVDVEPRQVVVIVIAGLFAQQLDLGGADGILTITGIAQHLPEATRRGLLLDATSWHGVAEDLHAGAYQVVPNDLLDPTPRPEALLTASGCYATDQRDWCIDELTRQP